MGRAKKLHLEQDLSFPGFDGNLSLAAAMQPASVATIVIADAEPGAAPGLRTTHSSDDSNRRGFVCKHVGRDRQGTLTLLDFGFS